MKLAESWVEDTPTGAALEGFHDEVEEHDEVDEAKDGCRGCGVAAVRAQRSITAATRCFMSLREKLKAWKRNAETNSIRLIGRGDLSPLGVCVAALLATRARLFCGVFGQTKFRNCSQRRDLASRIRAGEAQGTAFEGSDDPCRRGVRLLASLCRELQEIAGDQPFMLCQGAVAKLFGHSSHRNICNWIRALITLEILKRAEPAIPRARAARYVYLE